MIGYLSGELFEIHGNSVIILVNGVGYKVFPSLSFLETAKRSDKVSLFITTIVKEDALDLYGFSSEEEKKLFEMMVAISGIGPKTALGILSKGKINDIMNAIFNADLEFFSGVPRLGKKNAQKLIIELRNKTGNISDLPMGERGEREDLIQALESFGYSEKEIVKIIPEIEKNGGKIEQKVAFALKLLGRK